MLSEGTVEVKVIVALKRVADPDNANKVAIAADGSAVQTSGLEWKLNPFDEYALEAALRLTDYGLVADLFQAVPLLVDELRRRRS